MEENSAIHLKLTHHKYPQRSSKSLTEIQYYLKVYSELSSPQFTNPITGKTTDLLEFFKPMLRRRFVFAGIALTLLAFITNIYVLENLRMESAFLSYIAFMSANLGAAMLIPTFLIEFLNRIRRQRAKNRAQQLANSQIRQQLPSLEKITDELIIKLTDIESPIMNNLLGIFDGIKKDISAEELAIILNHIFTDDETDIAHLILDEEKFELSKNNFVQILQEGINYGHETGIIEDPKFIQFLSYSFAAGFLRHAVIEPESPYHFPNLDFEHFIELYQNYCAKFSFYCKNEYGVEPFQDHVEERIMILIDQLIFHDEEEEVTEESPKVAT